MSVDGIQGVRIPSPHIQRLCTAKQNIVDVVRNEDDGSFQLSETHSAQSFAHPSTSAAEGATRSDSGAAAAGA
eukprot:1765798-Prorocentrum_lima.AAC.1